MGLDCSVMASVIPPFLSRCAANRRDQPETPEFVAQDSATTLYTTLVQREHETQLVRAAVITPLASQSCSAAKRSRETRSVAYAVATDPRYAAMQLKLALLCLVTGADAFAARSTVRRTTRLAAAADDFPRETARAAYSRFDDVCADEECDARELADDNGWDELRRLARREEAQDRAAAEKAAIAAFRARLEERW